MIRIWSLLAVSAVAAAVVVLLVGVNGVGTWLRVLSLFAVGFFLLPFLLLKWRDLDWFHPLGFPAMYVGFVLLAPLLYVSSVGPVWIFSVDDISSALLLVVMTALISTMVGILGALRVSAGRASNYRRPRRVRWQKVDQASIGLLLGVAFVRVISFVASQGSNYGQNQLDYGAFKFLTIGLTTLFLPAVVLHVLATVNTRGRLLSSLGLTLIAFVSVLSMIRGSRDDILAVGIFLLWAQHTYVRRMTPSLLVGFTTMFLLVSSMISVARTGEFNVDVRGMADGTIADVASPMFLTASVIDLTEISGFSNGSTYLAAISYLPPGPVARALFGPPEATASFVFRDLIGLDNRDFGYSFAFIAEGYLNFGKAGVALASFALGYFLAWSWSISRQPATYARELLYPVAIALLPISYRSDALTPLKALGWGMATLWLVLAMASTRRSVRSAAL